MFVCINQAANVSFRTKSVRQTRRLRPLNVKTAGLV